MHCFNLGPNGCVPYERMQQTDRAVKLAEHQIPTTAEVIRMYEERGGVLTRDASVGYDPLSTREDLLESREYMFKSLQPSFEEIFSDIMQGRDEAFILAVIKFYEITLMLS